MQRLSISVNVAVRVQKVDVDPSYDLFLNPTKAQISLQHRRQDPGHDVHVALLHFASHLKMSHFAPKNVSNVLQLLMGNVMSCDVVMPQFGPASRGLEPKYKVKPCCTRCIQITQSLSLNPQNQTFYVFCRHRTWSHRGLESFLHHERDKENEVVDVSNSRGL